MTLKDGLVAYYKMDGNSNDATGNGNNGIDTNVTYVTGKINQAGNYNGSNSYTTIPDWGHSSFDSGYTYAFWINANSHSSDGFFVNTNYFSMRFKSDNTIQIRDYSGSVEPVITSSTLSTSTDYFVVARYTGTSLQLYINNVFIGESPLPSVASTTRFNGFGRYTSGNYYNGTLDEVCIYDRALISTEITELYNDNNGLTYPFFIFPDSTNYLKNYLIKLTNDAGTVLEFGNYDTKLKSIIDCNINRENKNGIGTIRIDNRGSSYDTDFLTLNKVEIFIIIDSAEVKRFSGTVEENNPNADNTSITLTCHDNNAILSHRTIVGTWDNIDLGALVKVILEEKCPEIDVTGINITTGETFDLVQSASLYISDFFDDIFKESNYNLFIDDDLVAQLYETRGSSGITIIDSQTTTSTTESQGLLVSGSLDLKKSNVSNINSVTVIGGNEQIPDFIENFTYTGSKNFPLKYRVATVSPDYVKVNGTPVSQATDYDLSQSRTLLHFTSTLTTGDAIEIKYTGEDPVWWREQDLSVTSDNLREYVVTDNTILTLERATKLASSLLSKFKTIQEKGSLKAVNITKEFFKGQTINLDITSFTDTYKIEGYYEYIGDTYICSFSLNQILDMNTKKIYELIKDLQKAQNTTQSIQTIRDGYTITDIIEEIEELEGYQQGIGNVLIVNNAVSGKVNSDDYQVNGSYGTETQFL